MVEVLGISARVMPGEGRDEEGRKLKGKPSVPATYEWCNLFPLFTKLTVRRRRYTLNIRRK